MIIVGRNDGIEKDNPAFCFGYFFYCVFCFACDMRLFQVAHFQVSVFALTGSLLD